MLNTSQTGRRLDRHRTAQHHISPMAPQATPPAIRTCSPALLRYTDTRIHDGILVDCRHLRGRPARGPAHPSLTSLGTRSSDDTRGSISDARRHAIDELPADVSTLAKQCDLLDSSASVEGDRVIGTPHISAQVLIEAAAPARSAPSLEKDSDCEDGRWGFG
jgi:hypothetical protein